MLRTILALLILASAQAAAAQGNVSAQLTDDVPLDVYLDALAQISPAAREGASAYLEAYRRRCGRSLRTFELRRAVAEGAGDPVLMAMIRAISLRDTTTLQAVERSLVCPRSK